MRKLAIIAIIFIAIAAQPETAGSEQAPENPPEVLFFYQPRKWHCKAIRHKKAQKADKILDKKAEKHIIPGLYYLHTAI